MVHEEMAPGTPMPDLDVNEVMRIIPHRFPMLMLDAVTDIRAFERAVGIKNVTINEPFFGGHFPGDPIMPGVLIIEAMAQTAAVLVIASMGAGLEGSPVYFMSVDRARFRRPIRPGHQLRLEVELVRSRLGVYRFEGRATVNGALATEAQFGAKLVAG